MGTYLGATPELAVCDVISGFESANTLESLENLMFNFMRFDEESIIDLGFDRTSVYAETYRSANVRLLERFLRRRPGQERSGTPSSEASREIDSQAPDTEAYGKE